MTEKTAEYTFNEIVGIDNHFWNEYGYTSRPNGYEYIELVLKIADYIAYEAEYIGAITPEVLEMLTANNYHTARKAAEIVLQLGKYAYM